MLTDLNFLMPNKTWPPPGEEKRIKRYQENERLFLTEHGSIWGEKFRDLARKFKKKNCEVGTSINYHQLISKKTADFVCGEPPKIETEGETDKLVNLLNDQNFFALLYEGFIDVSKDGNAIIKIVGQDATAVSPIYWYPVVDPTNLKRIIYNVIAYPTNFDDKNNPTQLYAEIHTDKTLETRIFAYDAKSKTIGTYITDPKTESLVEPAVHILSNLTYSGSIFGMDDYNIINDIVSKIMWRLHCADTVLDKHSEPSVSGPSSALEFDEKFGWFVPLGNFFKRDSVDDPPLEYITWDGSLEDNWKEIELLFNQLYILSEMGQAFSDAKGGDSSGTALKLRMVSPRIKAQRLVGINAATVKSLIIAIARLNKIDINYDTLKIYWSDGLPIDEKEQIDMLRAATGDKPIMSQFTAIKKRGLSDTDAEIELQTIQDEEAAAAPVIQIPHTVNAETPESNNPEVDNTKAGGRQ